MSFTLVTSNSQSTPKIPDASLQLCLTESDAVVHHIFSISARTEGNKGTSAAVVAGGATALAPISPRKPVFDAILTTGQGTMHVIQAEAIIAQADVEGGGFRYVMITFPK